MTNVPKELAESIENSKAEYKQLGKCGLRVSVPILGAMSFGHKDWMPWVLNEEDVCDSLNRKSGEKLTHDP